MTAVLAAVLAFAAVAWPGPPARGRNRRRHRRRRRLAGAGTSTLARLRKWARPDDHAAEVAELLELTARALRAGASLPMALETASAELPGAGLAPVTRRIAGGLSVAEAIDGWAAAATGSRTAAARRTAAALLVLGHGSGAAMAASLDRAAASIHQRRATHDEIRALTAQTRASGLLVALAPAGFGVFVALIDGDALRVLVATPVGWLSLLAGLALEALGVWWMARLARGVSAWA